MAEWPPYEKELSARLTLCSLYTSTCYLVISRFGFEGGNLVPIALVPVHCLLVAYDIFSKGYYNIAFALSI